MQILWRPEIEICTQCHHEGDVRMFTSDNIKTYFCKNCWNDFILECDIKSGSWENQIVSSWNSDIDLILIPKIIFNKAVGWN